MVSFGDKPDNSLTASWRNAAGNETYYTYDANGSCTQIWTPNGSTYFEYTAANLVRKIAVEGGGATLEYSYDGQLNRYKYLANGLTYFNYWEEGRLMNKRTGPNAASWYGVYSYGPSMAGVPQGQVFENPANRNFSFPNRY